MTGASRQIGTVDISFTGKTARPVATGYDADLDKAVTRYLRSGTRVASDSAYGFDARSGLSPQRPSRASRWILVGLLSVIAILVGLLWVVLS